MLAHADLLTSQQSGITAVGLQLGYYEQVQICEFPKSLKSLRFLSYDYSPTDTNDCE